MPNFKKFLNKKVIFVFIFVLILVAGGLFFWWQNRETKGSIDDYVIKETAGGMIVENKKAGLSIKVPDDWEIKKIEKSEGSVVINTPDIQGKEWNKIIVPPLIKGCGIETSVVYKKMTFEEIKQEVLTIHWGLNVTSEEFEEIIVNSYVALKNNFDSEILGSAIVIYIPKGNKLYDFDLYFSPNEQEKCIQEFERFLETISIK